MKTYSSEELHEMFQRAYKHEDFPPNDFCDIAVVYRCYQGDQYMDVTCRVTVKKDGSDCAMCIVDEAKTLSCRYESVEFDKIL